MKRVICKSGRKYLFIALLAFSAFALMPAYSSQVQAYSAHNSQTREHVTHHFGGPQWQMLMNGYNDPQGFVGSSSCLTIPYHVIYPALVSQLCTDQPQQLFAFVPTGQPGVFTIQVSTGGCLAVSDLGAIVRRVCGAYFASNTQLWQHSPVWFGGAQGFQIFQVGRYGLCLTARPNSSVGLGACFGPLAHWYFPRPF